MGPRAWCQTAQGTGTISGHASDSTHSALKGARAVLQPTGVAAVSDDQGQFLILGVPAGKYTLTVSYIGFSDFSAPVTVVSGQSAQVEAVLPIGSVSQEVTVRGERESGEIEALNIERTADNIIEVLPTEVITSLPNTNVADALGHTHLCTWHPDQRQLLAYQAPGGARTTFSYDERGNIATLEDPLGQTTKTRWQAGLSLPLERTHPDGSAERWDYDSTGKLTRYTRLPSENGAALIEHWAHVRPDPLMEQLIAAAMQVRAAQPNGSGPGRTLAEPLTAAELRILKLLPTSTYLQMAATLYISRNTVKTHLRSIYQKLGVASRSEALERAVDLRSL